MKIYLARHGTTNYNDKNLCNSDPNIDVHLTELGKRQAVELSDALIDTGFDCIYVSELRRTSQTADVVNKYHSAPVLVEPLLNDHRSGFEGRNANLLLGALSNAPDYWTVKFNGGESIVDVRDRVGSFLAQIQNEKYESILIITSGWVIRCAISVILNIPLEKAWEQEPEQGKYLQFDLN